MPAYVPLSGKTMELTVMANCVGVPGFARKLLSEGVETWKNAFPPHGFAPAAGR